MTKWPQVKVRAAVVVLPAETKGSDRISQFGPVTERPLGALARPVPNRSDPWMPFSRAGRLAMSWDADLTDLGQAGHINVASGFGPRPGGKWLRDDLLGVGPVGGTLLPPSAGTRIAGRISRAAFKMANLSALAFVLPPDLARGWH